MNAEQLSKVGSDLVRRCGTRDPFLIANALGINVMDDCENLGSLKGMYCIVKRNRFIFLNKDLSPQMKRIVCAHEIGHDRLHRALAKKHGLQEFVLYGMATKPEYEANIVAAEILLDSDLFACVSFLRVKRKVDLPERYFVLTLGLSEPLTSDRVAVKTEPYPGRWTTHFVISSPSDLDEELFGWIEQAYQFAQEK